MISWILILHLPICLLQVHQGSVDTYLEDIILQSVESTADQQAREEIRQQADNINKIAHDFEHTYVKIIGKVDCDDS